MLWRRGCWRGCPGPSACCSSPEEARWPSVGCGGGSRPGGAGVDRGGTWQSDEARGRAGDAAQGCRRLAGRRRSQRITGGDEASGGQRGQRHDLRPASREPRRRDSDTALLGLACRNSGAAPPDFAGGAAAQLGLVGAAVQELIVALSCHAGAAAQVSRPGGEGAVRCSSSTTLGEPRRAAKLDLQTSGVGRWKLEDEAEKEGRDGVY